MPLAVGDPRRVGAFEIATMAQLRWEGWMLKDIAQELGRSTSTVRHLLLEAGMTEFKRVPNRHGLLRLKPRGRGGDREQLVWRGRSAR